MGSEFLKAKSGDTVLVGDQEIGKVLSFLGGARDPFAPTLFQVAKLDTREIHWVRDDEVKGIVSSRDNL